MRAGALAAGGQAQRGERETDRQTHKARHKRRPPTRTQTGEADVRTERGSQAELQKRTLTTYVAWRYTAAFFFFLHYLRRRRLDRGLLIGWAQSNAHVVAMQRRDTPYLLKHLRVRNQERLYVCSIILAAVRI